MPAARVTPAQARQPALHGDVAAAYRLYAALLPTDDAAVRMAPGKAKSLRVGRVAYF